MTAAALILLLFWALLACDTKRWWPRDPLAERPSDESSTALESSARAESVTVIVPARNEASILESTLPALIAQSSSYTKLVLVDDRSTDGTGDLARRLARSLQTPELEKILVLTSDPPPAGWLGKLHALQTGLERCGADSEWLLFTDADILHPRGSISRLVAKARQDGRDLVSIMVRLRTEAFWEKLLIPPFVWFFQLLYPFRRVADSRSSVAAAAGGCVLIRRSLLEKAGGLELIRGEIIDDVSLARIAKRAGGRLWLGLNPEMLSVRGYETLGEITRMVARTAFDQLGYRYSLVVGTFFFLGFFFAAPPVMALLGVETGNHVAMWLALAAVLIQAGLFLPAVRHHGVSLGYAFTLPLASALYAYMTGVSAWRHFRGRGVEWRGRRITRP